MLPDRFHENRADDRVAPAAIRLLQSGESVGVEFSKAVECSFVVAGPRPLYMVLNDTHSCTPAAKMP